MPVFTYQQPIRQLEKRKGGYYYFEIPAEAIEQFEKKRHTRLICSIDEKLTYSCGLNHLGDGNFFIILATRHLKKLGKELEQVVTFSIQEDPNPLGVEIPEVLQALLSQDQEIANSFNDLTDGKKRSLIYSLQRLKDIDKQVNIILTFLEQEKLKATRLAMKRGQ